MNGGKKLFEDENDFNVFFKTYYQLVYNYALSHLKNTDVATDIVQDAFIKIWNQKDCLDPTQNIKSYLYTITKNLVHDELRKKVQFFKYSNYYKSRFDEGTNSNEERQAYQELESLYLQAINSLPEKRRNIFYLSKVQHFTNHEIAEELKISINTVKDQLCKGNKYIKSYLSKRSFSFPKKIFFLVVVFCLSMCVYVLKKERNTEWTRQDLTSYIRNT